MMKSCNPVLRLLKRLDEQCFRADRSTCMRVRDRQFNVYHKLDQSLHCQIVG